MKKLRLNVDELRVESFASEARSAGLGTVRGNSGNSDDTLCDILTCGGGDTCDSRERPHDGAYR